MIGSRLQGHSLESYMVRSGCRGYYFLAQDRGDQWYWGPAEDEHADPRTTDFTGPCVSRGKAIMAGEDWVAASCP